MPELPEVEAVRISLEKRFQGGQVKLARVSSKALRKPLGIPKGKLKSLKLEDFRRWGKRLLLGQTNGPFLEFSLGMSGSIREAENGKLTDKHDHFSVEFESAGAFVFNDPRRFGWVKYFSRISKDLMIGWDPLEGDVDSKHRAQRKFRESNRSLYSLLMDQSLITGLGNIYVQELLFREGLSPHRLGTELNESEVEGLFGGAQCLLREAVRCGGSTLRDHRLLTGESGSFQKKHRVYGLKKGEPCENCGSKLLHQGKPRTLTWCEVCQK